MVRAGADGLDKEEAKQDSRLIWERMSTARPLRRLTYQEIAAAAIALADEGGEESVSMRSLAKRLGSGTMSLYRYVINKNDLWDLMLDGAFGEIALPSRISGHWRRDVIRAASETRRTMLRHSWLAGLVTARPTLGPNYLRWFEFLLEATAQFTSEMRMRVRVIGAVWAYTSGYVGHELGEQKTARKYQLDEANKREIAARYLEQVLVNGKFPELAKFMKTYKQGDPDEEFEFGLRALLKGLGGS